MFSLTKARFVFCGALMTRPRDTEWKQNSILLYKLFWYAIRDILIAGMIWIYCVAITCNYCLNSRWKFWQFFLNKQRFTLCTVNICTCFLMDKGLIWPLTQGLTQGDLLYLEKTVPTYLNGSCLVGTICHLCPSVLKKLYFLPIVNAMLLITRVLQDCWQQLLINDIT